MTATYNAIATTTLTATATTVSFTSISGSYTDLVVIVKAKNFGGGTTFGMRFNSDSGSNYSSGYFGASNGSTLNTFTSSTSASYNGQSQSDEFATNVINIMGYSNTNVQKIMFSEVNQPNGYTLQYGAVWANTSAITSIDFGNFDSGTQYWVTGSSFAIYGIAKE